MPGSISRTPPALRRHPLAEAIARVRRPLLASSLLLGLTVPAFGAPVEIELSALATGGGSQGFVMNGFAFNAHAGYSVSGAGDVNDDGIDDLIVGAFQTSANGGFPGESYVVFGRSSGFDATLELSTLKSANGGNGAAGFAIVGDSIIDFSGYAVGAAGDVNDDGIDDIMVGASGADRIYVLFGKSSGFDAELELSTLKSANGGDGTAGFVLNGLPYSQSGASVSTAGDVNGDGIDDVIVGSRYLSPSGGPNGLSYVVFGRSTGFAAELELSALKSANGGDGSAGFTLNGANNGGSWGAAVSAAGDVSGDGIDDVILGAVLASPGGRKWAGETYVVFGHTGAFAPELEVSGLKAANGGNGSTGFALNGTAAYDFSGSSVSDAGDVNGDGIDDCIVGAYLAGPNGPGSGQSYVVFGSSSGFAAEIELSALLAANGGDGSAGFALNGAAEGDRSGNSVSAAGDVNGDGMDDIIIGSERADPNGGASGQGYVVFGRSSGFGPELELSALKSANGGSGKAGFVLNGTATGAYAGCSVSAAGDVNGDGTGDIILGAHGASPNGMSSSGQGYVIFGVDTVPTVFSLPAVSDVPPDTWISSNAVVVSDLDTSAPTTISGGEYAINGGAYTSASGSVSAGDSVVVQVLSSMLYSDSAAATLTIGTADGTSASFIATTEPASLSIANLMHAEGNSDITPFDFTVSLNGPSAVDVMVDYSISGITATEGVDFQQPPPPHSLAIPAGNSTGILSVPVLGDTAAEPDEQFQVQLANPQNAGLSNTLATGTIQNDDAPPPPLFADGFESGETSAWSSVVGGS